MFFFLIVSPQIVQVDFDELAAVIEVLASCFLKKALDGLLLHVRQTKELLKGLDPAEDIDAFHAVKGGGEL